MDTRVRVRFDQTPNHSESLGHEHYTELGSWRG